MYSQVLSISREVEWGLKKKSEKQVQNKSVKRPFQLMNEEDAARATNGPIVKRPFRPPLQQRYAGTAESPDQSNAIAERLMGYVWYMDPAITRWVIVHSSGPIQHHQHFQHKQHPQHFQSHHWEGTQNPLTKELLSHPSSMISHRGEQELEQTMAEAKSTTWRQRKQRQ